MLRRACVRCPVIFGVRNAALFACAVMAPGAGHRHRTSRAMGAEPLRHDCRLGPCRPVRADAAPAARSGRQHALVECHGRQPLCAGDAGGCRRPWRPLVMGIPARGTNPAPGFGWFSIVRLGLVQASIGAIVMLATSLLNRVMVVEYGMAAAIPAGLVALHYAVQLARPVWATVSDKGHRRTPWIIGGIAVLGSGALIAVCALPLVAPQPLLAVATAILGFVLIGAGVGAAGTSLLALLASGVAPTRRAAAAALAPGS